jgi:hypothetical protein
MNRKSGLGLILAGIALFIMSGLWLAGPERADAQGQPCTFGPSRPLTEATIYDRQPRITISAMCPGAATRLEGYIDNQRVQIEQTGLGTPQVTLAMRPTNPLNLGVHYVNFIVEGSVFSWGFTVVETQGKVWASAPNSTQAACPQTSGSWQLLYWGGDDLTSIDSAASLCPTVDRVWLNRSGRWLGYSVGNDAGSDLWIIIGKGEAHFLRAK